MKRHVLIPLAILFMLPHAADTLLAQPVWMQPREDNLISIEWFKAFAPSGSEIDFVSGAFFLGAKFQMGEGVQLVAEVPFVHSSGAYVMTVTQDGERSTTRQEYSKFLLGSIYAGLEIGGEDSPFFSEVGIRLPTTESMDEPEYDIASEDAYWDYFSYLHALMIGLWSDIERYGAFRPLGVSGDSRYVTAQAMLNYQPALSASGLGFRLRGGPQFFVPTARGNLEAGISLTVQGLYKTGPVYVLGGYSGLAALTAENFGIKEGLAHHVILGLSVDLEDALPGLQLRVPLDNNGSDFYQSSVVFQVAFVLDGE